MKKIEMDRLSYRITQHRKHGTIRYSIDELGYDGKYLCQIAAFFKTREQAERRLQEIMEQS